VSYIVAQISPFWLINVLISLSAAFLAGGFLAWVSAVLKTKYGVNVVVSSVMISYIVINFAFWVLENVFHDPDDYAPWGWQLPTNAQIPRIFGYLHFGIFVALFCVLVVYVLFSKLTLGYHITAAGLNEKAAACAGIDTHKVTWIALFLSGGFYALAGCVEVLGVDHRMRNDWSAEFAFTGIPIALLGNLTPIGILLAALFFGMFFQGTRIAQLGTAVPPAILGVIQALILIFTLVGAYARTKFTRSRV
jgi:simple sugar transport system permease protein